MIKSDGLTHMRGAVAFLFPQKIYTNLYTNFLFYGILNA